MEGFYGAKGTVESCQRRDPEGKGSVAEGRGDATGEYKAMHEENFLSSWLREDGREKEERMFEVSSDNEEARGEKRRSEGEKEENETETV